MAPVDRAQNYEKSHDITVQGQCRKLGMVGKLFLYLLLQKIDMYKKIGQFESQKCCLNSIQSYLRTKQGCHTIMRRFLWHLFRKLIGVY